ncbi:MAG: methyltransferase domain-containing protein [Acidobacteriales bacterium]|nr:methyltransferase domain-containing protein [Terriglobales bacterium]
MRRTVIPELLDSDSGSPQEVKASLADLRFANRWFGGVSTTCRLLEHVAHKLGARQLHVLDVGAGTGYVAAAAAERMRQQGIDVSFVLLDRAASHLNGNFPAVAGDALALPFADDSFDLVTCSLFVHHLEPDEIRRFVGDALRVARVAVLINDVRRSPVHLALVYAALPLFSRLTRHDAPASVRRAYTAAELSDILRSSGANDVEVTQRYLFRLGGIVWKAAT